MSELTSNSSHKSSLLSLPKMPIINTNHFSSNHFQEPLLRATTCSDHHPIMQVMPAADRRERQAMFEKPLTPSDVGKLNRLVIPKQYAEKYFPVAAAAADKGLLLGFEDEEEAGKLWRFRYSYWSSSQSYVLTKGWSRYVKDKSLAAGDLVVFRRHRLDAHRLFIACKRRRSPPHPAAAPPLSGGGWNKMFCSPHPYHLPSPPYQSSSHSPHAESSVQSPTVSVGNSKILRLFGVNLECQTDEVPPPLGGGGSDLSGRNDPTRHQCSPHYSPLPRHMDFTFSQDVKQTKYNQG